MTPQQRDRRTGGRARRAAWLMAAALLATALAGPGCARPRAELLVATADGPRWPAPPAPARLVYLGALGGEADLGRARSAFGALGDWLVGAREPVQLQGPRAVCCLADGQHVWVADVGGRSLVLLDLARRTCQTFDTLGGQPLLAPVALCRGPGATLYVCDAQQIAIHQVDDRTGELVQTLRLPEDVLRPVAVQYHAETRELFVVDAKAHDLKVLTEDGSLLRRLGGRGDERGRFNFPCAVLDDGESLWIADAGNHRVQRIGYDGTPMASLGQEGDSPGDLAMPKAVARDRAGHLYVVDARFENVQVFDERGQLLLFFGEEGTGPGQFWLPSGIFIDGQDRVWVCDTYNARLQVFQYVDTPDTEATDQPRLPATP